ncbi:hypothetical protein C5167_023742 [Papaver somniferum]|uniref:Uncharacterized protein n=1 Tax=Papaver somniferum TaxID=3469 RepID=A0A4Y7JPM9_PAPSO|nr:hypothetical protein C5167_023742 [Papaver somniferum]
MEWRSITINLFNCFYRSSDSDVDDSEEEESGGDSNSGSRSRLTVVFLAFDVCFSISCVALACVIKIALSCCFPCIIEFLYAEVGQEGAS